MYLAELICFIGCKRKMKFSQMPSTLRLNKKVYI